MQKPPIPENEHERLDALRSYTILDTPAQEDFDFLTAMASKICNTPIALITLIDQNRQWHLSHHGFAVKEINRDISFCAHAIVKPNEVLIIEDASKDQRFFDHPAVVGGPQLKSYSGVPLVTESGFPLGTFCVIDQKANKLTEEQLVLLKQLARQTVQLLELRKKNIELTKLQEELKKSNELLEETQSANQIGAWELNYETGETVWTKEVFKIHELPLDFDHNKAKGISFYHPEDQPLLIDALQKAYEQEIPFDLTLKFITAKGNNRWVRSTGKKLDNRLIGSFQDITNLKNGEIKFKGIYDSTLTMIGFLSPNGIIYDVNQTALDFIGLKKDEVIGKYLWDTPWWPETNSLIEKVKESVIHASLGQELSYETEIKDKEGRSNTILFSIKPIYDEKGAIAYLIPEGRPIQEIIETRNRYKSVIEGTNVGTWEWNVQTGETVFNERWAEILGYTLAEISPTNIDTWSRLCHPEDLLNAYKVLQVCFNKKTAYYEAEVRMLHKEGHWVWIHDKGKVFEWTKEGLPLKMYGTHQDITDRKLHEQELNYSNNLLNALYELSPIGIALTDYETGRFIDVNPKLVEPTGYTKEELLSLTYWDLTPEEFYPEEHSLIKMMTTKDRYGPYEKLYRRKDGSTYPVLLRGMVIKDLNNRKLLWSIIQDISQEKEAEARLHEALNRIEAILDASTQVAIIATDKNGIITLFNSGAEHLLGAVAEDMVGVTPLESLHLREEILLIEAEINPDTEPDIRGFEALIYPARGGQPYTREWTYVRNDGIHVPVLLSITSIKQEGEIIGYLGVATDITVLKKAESEIRTLLSLTKDQNERLKNFAHIVSHNLRSHSGGISGLLELLLSEQPDWAEHEYMQLLKQGVDNLMQTILDLTEMVKVNLNTESRVAIDLSKVIQKNIDSLVQQVRNSGIQIENRIPATVTIFGVPAYVDSIVLNFITNAIKYRSPERTPFLIIESEQKENFLILRFKDNGLGIDLQKHGEKLFGMYKTFHQHPDSRGVGLFITRNQVESMGGKIEVASTIGNGSTFSVYLPCKM